MLQKVARDEKVPLVQVNTVGANDELIFDGHSVALDAQGGIMAMGAAFAEEVLIVDLASPGKLSRPVEEKAQQLASALALGIRDYVRKCGFHSVVLGLSGGIDSAVVAALAVQALGPDKVLGVSMPARYSSQGSKDDALALAKNLGIRYETIAIEDSFLAMEKQLEPVFTGRKPDLTEENIQSRLRGVTLMALSNKFGSLVLTTGNKSEMAVGYCTLYGDMCGALAVIADVFKTEVYDLARWMNREKEVIPQSTIDKVPSAELRPNQTDQDSLPDYATLDAILKAYVVENKACADIVAEGYKVSVVEDVINKVIMSEYKRRQAAPGLKVSARAFGMGRRIPIAQRFRT
jgi:NAD+ synthetase